MLSSKKIKKGTASAQGASKESRRFRNKYKTFNPIDKRSILTGLKQAILDLNIINPEKSDLSSSDLLECMNTIDRDELNKILQGLLQRHNVFFETNVKGMRSWRKKIREWISANGQTERKGHFLISPDKLELFKDYLIPQLQEMPHRSLGLLKEKLFYALNKIEHPRKQNIFSKHWWYDFLERNPDVKDTWKSLPKRAANPIIFSDWNNSESDASSQMEVESQAGVPEEYKDQENSNIAFVEEPAQNEIDKIIEEIDVAWEWEDFQFENLFPIQQEQDWHQGDLKPVCLFSDNLCRQVIEAEQMQLESSVSSGIDAILNPEASKDEILMEKLTMWRETKLLTRKPEPLEEESLFQKSLQKVYRELCHPEQKGVAQFLETALDMKSCFEDCLGMCNIQ